MAMAGVNLGILQESILLARKAARNKVRVVTKAEVACLVLKQNWSGHEIRDNVPHHLHTAPVPRPSQYHPITPHNSLDQTLFSPPPTATASIRDWRIGHGYFVHVFLQYAVT